MLTKRVNILFDQKIWTRLQKRAKRLKRSTSDLVREAVEQLPNDEVLKKRKEAYEWILKNRPKPVKGRIDYKAMINYRRKI